MKKIALILVVIGLMLPAVPTLAQQTTDSFYITVGLVGNVWSAGGSGYNCGEWYCYPSGWINEWFYDHPFDAQRGKIIHIEFDYVAYAIGVPTDMTVAVNWSNEAWSQLGHGLSLPPLPGCEENQYIVRQEILHECGSFPEVQHFSTDLIVEDYNPEWVSIDVRGTNFVITCGVLVHECVVGTEKSSWGSIKGLFQ